MNTFKIGDKVRVLNKGNSILEFGDIGIISEIFGKSIRVAVKDKMNRENWVEMDGVELIEPRTPKNQRIKKLEKQIEELEKIIKDYFKLPIQSPIDDLDVIEFEGAKYRRVDRLASEGDVVIFTENIYKYLENNKPYRVHKGERNLFLGIGVLLYLPSYGRSVKNTKVYELITSLKTNENKELECEYEEQVKAEEKPNQLRAEIIEKAKGFVEKHTIPNCYFKGWRDRGGISWGVFAVIPEFYVNHDKRIITLLLKGASPLDGKVKTRFFAKCNPNDVFNEHIGKAIALGRALGLDVSEFEKAVQPTEVVNGHIVKGKFEGRVVEVTSIEDNGEFKSSDFKPFEYSLLSYIDKIIEDTNAIYKG